jgi:hypothetical protein
MNHFDSHLSAASAAVASIAAAAVMSFPLDSLHAVQTVPAHTLGCEWVEPAAASAAPAGGGASLRLVNQSPQTLRAGQRFHWVTLGTPVSAGASGVLPADLAPGDSLALNGGPVMHAAGCAAVALR